MIQLSLLSIEDRNDLFIQQFQNMFNLHINECELVKNEEGLITKIICRAIEPGSVSNTSSNNSEEKIEPGRGSTISEPFVEDLPLFRKK